MISNETIEEIKSRVNIVEVIGQFVKLTKKGVNDVGLCPFHSEKSGSFTVTKTKGYYKCFGCGKSGDSISFIMEHEKKGYVQALKFLADRYGIEIEDVGPQREYIKPVARLEKLGKKTLAWFEGERKISNDTLLRMKITEAVEFMPQFGKEVPAICYNYFRKEELVNIKFRGPKKSFKLAKDAELIFYNIDALEGEKECVIVEGENDALAFIEAGVYNVVSVPNGASKGNQKLDYLNNCWESFLNLESVIIAVDDDEAGRMLKEELGRRIGKEKCKIVEFPKGCKDANQVLIEHGRERLREVYQTAKDWPLEGIKVMDDIFPTVEDWFKNGYPEGSKCRIPGFDPLLRFAPGQMTMGTGIPGHGKDEFFNWIMASLAKHEEWPFGVCGFEESPEETTSKLIEKIVGKAFDKRKNENDRVSQREFEMGIAFVDQYFHFFNTDEIATGVDGLLEIAARLVQRFGIRGLYLNPWNWIEHNRPAGMNETEYISLVLGKIIRFAKKWGVHVFLIAHTTKIQKDKQTKKYLVPTLYDIAGSANFFNKTHNGVTVYRNYETHLVDVYVQKVKQSWLGQIGFSTYQYNTLTRQYTFVSSSVDERGDMVKQVKEAMGGKGKWKPVAQMIDFTEASKPDDDEAPF